MNEENFKVFGFGFEVFCFEIKKIFNLILEYLYEIKEMMCY